MAIELILKKMLLVLVLELLLKMMPLAIVWLYLLSSRCTGMLSGTGCSRSSALLADLVQ